MTMTKSKTNTNTNAKTKDKDKDKDMCQHLTGQCELSQQYKPFTIHISWLVFPDPKLYINDTRVNFLTASQDSKFWGLQAPMSLLGKLIPKRIMEGNQDWSSGCMNCAV